MEKREAAIRLWFEMWRKKADLGIADIFAADAVYIESWGPEYHGVRKIQAWFRKWNTRGTVLRWDIERFFHDGDRTAVVWRFQYQMDGEPVNGFEGMSLVTWAADGKISALQEFGCNERRYDPYKDGPAPVFEETEVKWF